MRRHAKFAKVGKMVVAILQFTIFKMGAVHHLGFSKFDMAKVHHLTNFIKVGQTLMRYRI